MSTTYCTSCGAESTKRICRNCGVKQDKVHRFCKYCGQPLPEKASICVKCKEKVKGDSFFWSLLNLVCAIIPFFVMIMAIEEGYSFVVCFCFALSFLFCLPLSRKIINRYTRGQRGIRMLLKILRVLLVIGLFAFGMQLVSSAEPETPTTEEVYGQIVDYAQQGLYLDARNLSANYPEVKEYQDTKAYLTYCDAMRAYEAGGLGYAYEQLLTVPQILDAQAHIHALENEICRWDGVYIEDNGVGSYLYLVIENGQAFCDVVAYADYTEDYSYDLSQEFCDDIVKDQFSTGEDYYALGRYSSIGAEVTVKYAMYIFEESDEIMLIAAEGSEFHTFNGLYEKIA